MRFMRFIQRFIFNVCIVSFFAFVLFVATTIAVPFIGIVFVGGIITLAPFITGGDFFGEDFE